MKKYLLSKLNITVIIIKKKNESTYLLKKDTE